LRIAQVLSGKDRKTIRNKLATLFDADAIDALLKSDKIIYNKVTGSKMLIYVGKITLSSSTAPEKTTFPQCLHLNCL
jgi:hypothetical protein